MKRSIDWHDLSRHSRLARVMYPHLTDPESQRDMAQLSRNEGKKSPLQVHQEQPKQGRKWYAKNR